MKSFGLRFVVSIALMSTVAVCSTASAAPPLPAAPTLTEAQKAKIVEGEVVVFATREDPDSTVATATGIVEIDASQAEIFAILASEAHSENASKAMKDCIIRADERLAPDHRRLTMTYVMKVGPTEIEWTVNRDLYEGHGLLEFEIDDSYDNAIAWTDGYYAMHPGVTAGHVMVVYVSNLDSGRRIPRWLEEDLTQGSLRRYLAYLKFAAEAH
jgi:hypothetical protein